jgi:peptidoglycan/LPS O-acetylase OafA/YrhL
MMAAPLDPRPTSWRPEIQALRALAIVSVVVFHSWPGLAPGGQVGVDVFFVVSGFLITAMLVRERESTGRIGLTRFALGRARRLVPSALIVLAACAAATVSIMPAQYRDQLAREIAASALIVQNWNLNLSAGVPGAEPLSDSPLRHFWSLSVEEQFYLVWPGLIALAFLLVARHAVPRLGLAVIIGALTLASFGWNVALTQTDSSLAYFSTFARAWEFGVGGLVALIPGSTSLLSAVQRTVLSWLGVALILVAIVVPWDENSFPGWIVLVPVLGTAAVIWAGAPAHAWGTDRLARLGVVQWLGGLSYALYLWHWPVISFTPFVTGEPSPWWLVAVLIGISVLLAWATTRFVEGPIRALGAPPRVVVVAERDAQP